mmetsp:Transcript_40727/g.73575  ORF Transcript_40727/g.73575 Transcript_40727/m.73575 type:complete len:130 (-) Transcript_40727:72-461(-)
MALTSSRRLGRPAAGGRLLISCLAICACFIARGLPFVSAPQPSAALERMQAQAVLASMLAAPMSVSAVSDEAQLRKIDGEDVDPVLVNVGLGVISLVVFIILPGVIASLFTNSSKFKQDTTDEEGREYK